MARTSDEILREALALPAAVRAAIAGTLLGSLDEEIDEDAEAQWSAEIARRLDALDSDSVRLIPWTTVRERLLNA